MQIPRLWPREGDADGQGLPGFHRPQGPDQMGTEVTLEDPVLLPLYSYQVASRVCAPHSGSHHPQPLPFMSAKSGAQRGEGNPPKP